MSPTLLDGLNPEQLLCLSVTPETLLACTAFRLRHPRRPPPLAILHGNLSETIGWRSRDPRRRLFDATSALLVELNHETVDQPSERSLIGRIFKTLMAPGRDGEPG